MTFETITVDRQGPVATVTLNRPEVHNAFNAAMIGELTDAFGDLGADESLRAIVLKGEGRSFCAGADVQWMRASLDFTVEENVADALRMSDMFNAINTAPQAVIGRVHGAALGGGMGLIAVCDIVVAIDSCRFGFTETRLGIIPAVISRYVLPKTGPSWARAYFLTGERFDAKRAQQIGLVHDVVASDEIDEAVRRRFDGVLASGPRAVREAKALISGLAELPQPQWRGYTAEKIAQVRTSPEGQEGLRAFLEKRNPSWK